MHAESSVLRSYILVHGYALRLMLSCLKVLIIESRKLKVFSKRSSSSLEMLLLLPRIQLAEESSMTTHLYVRRAINRGTNGA